MAKKILVVEDDMELAKAIQIKLVSKGYDVTTAYDGVEGLKKVKSDSPDLILLDIIMPKMDGYTFVKELKADIHTKQIPVIILTAKEKMQDLFAVEGVKDYIVKPFHFEELLEKMNKYLLKHE